MYIVPYFPTDVHQHVQVTKKTLKEENFFDYDTMKGLCVFCVAHVVVHIDLDVFIHVYLGMTC